MGPQTMMGAAPPSRTSAVSRPATSRPYGTAATTAGTASRSAAGTPLAALAHPRARGDRRDHRGAVMLTGNSGGSAFVPQVNGEPQAQAVSLIKAAGLKPS